MTTLASLTDQIRKCRVCLEEPDGKPLPHDPNPVLQVSAHARILIAGQAPGTRVHASSIPFTDPSGDRLRAWMGVEKDVFYDSEKIAIVPMGFCFPGLDSKGGDLAPRRECARIWRPQVMSHLKKLQLILVIGQYAQKWHLEGQTKKSLTETVADWRHYYETRSPRVLPIPHPSWRNNGWLRKNMWFEKELLPELQSQVKQILQ